MSSLWDDIKKFLEEIGILPPPPPPPRQPVKPKLTFRVIERRSGNIPATPSTSAVSGYAKRIPSNIQINRKQKKCPYCQSSILFDPYGKGWTRCQGNNCRRLFHTECWERIVRKNGCPICESKQGVKVG